MKIHIGGSFQPAVVDTNRSRRRSEHALEEILENSND
jgi:hypothetical protein